MSHGTYGSTLRIRGVQAFLWTQFLGAFNDNVSKIIVTFVVMAELARTRGAQGETQGAALVAAVFILPFLLFSGYSGYLADRFSKRRILVAVKVFEIGVMTLTIPGLAFHLPGLLLAVMFGMGVHSTFFSPSKYGIVPELVSEAQMSAANGLLEMSTFAAIVLGTAVGGALYQRWSGDPVVLGGALVLIAVTGFSTSLRIPRVPAAKPDAVLSLNPFAEVWLGAVRLWRDPSLWATLLGISFFWFLGALLQTALLPFGESVLHVTPAAATRLFTPLALGIATGSLAAGRLSGEKIELGLVPIGAIGLALFSFALALSANYLAAAVSLLLLGFFGGFFAVPLNALLQQRPAEDEKGRVQATNNFFQTVGILLAAGMLAGLGGFLSIRRILMIGGGLAVVATIYILARIPDFFIRFVLWLLTHTLYRIRIVGRPYVPARGPALIVVNHVSMIDGALVGACVQRFVRFMVYGPYYRLPVIGWLLRRLQAIPVSAANRREMLAAIERARAELAAGHVVCIFAEGAVTRTGNMLPFKRGFERIIDGLDVPIIPVYLDRLWGSVFSFKGEKFFWKWPERLPYPVTIAFGAPLPSSTKAAAVRQAILELGAEAIRARRPAGDLLHTEFFRSARRHGRSLAMADSTGQELTYGRASIAAVALARVLDRRTPGEDMVGTLLPASVGGALANIALLAAGRVPVNLNFTIGEEALDQAITQAGIRTIISSKRFLAKAGLPARPSMIFLEDLKAEVTPADRIAAVWLARLAPMAWVRRRYARRARTSACLATIIFSSGSTGVPKGVMLTHANILANVDSLVQVFPMNPQHRFMGVLPFFHSFGFTGTLWFPLLEGAGVVYHPNPIDAKTIGELADKYRVTMLISTPTFCNAYVRRCTKEQFAHLHYAIVGAEKLREPLATEFREKFGLGLLEGYGMTEMAPVVAVNRPNVDDGLEHQIGTKPGSVGHPIPGVAARIAHPETGVELATGEEGVLLVKGPNMMAGYLHDPARTSDVIRDGWYVTGDIAKLDEDGFIFITDRLSRFSKIGGEMVPHVRIEEAINAALGEVASVVTAVPDIAKGERLVAFYARPEVTPDELWARLAATDLPRLWLPRRDSLIPIEAIPVLGTGKTDLRAIKQLALDRAARSAV
jgi:acyl-[acyl-carrier-protein]-phospholipid O-acyltransferase/long-chain-fatty-acid--[acyl-carrier-protein] ligase